MPNDDENKKPNDIRHYLSSPGNDQTPRRRRRIVTSDESDDQHRTQTEMPAEQQRTANTRNALHEHVLQNQNIVQLSSDDDSMYIPLPRPQPAAAAAEQPRQQQLQMSPIITTDTPRPARTSRTERSPHAAAAPVALGGHKRTRSQHLPSTAFVGEAEESSSAGDQTSECAEDDTHGADLYRQAIASCRNATKARTQLRAATTKCRVCAKFASFLDHFL